MSKKNKKESAAPQPQPSSGKDAKIGEEVVHFTFQTFEFTGPPGAPPSTIEQHFEILDAHARNMSVKGLLGPLAMGLPFGNFG